MERRQSRAFHLNAAVRAWRLRLARLESLADGDLDELEDHLREEIRNLVESGRNEREAFELARLRLGEEHSLDTAFQEGLVVDRSPLTDVRDLLASLRVTGRGLLRTPVFSLVTVATLAIGVGAITTTFTLLNGILLQPLPYPQSDRLVSVFHTAPGLGYEEIPQSLATYLIYREHGRTLEEIGLWFPLQLAITGRGRPRQVAGMQVTPGLFRVFDVEPHLGRPFREEDTVPGSPRFVLLDYGYWQSDFGADPAVVGRTLRVDGVDHQIAGVLPSGFRILDSAASVYLPFRYDPAEVKLTSFSYESAARLPSGVTPEAAQRELSGLVPLAPEVFPGGLTLTILEEARFDVRVVPLKSRAVGDVRGVLWLLAGAVGLILLISWVNVFNLFAVRVDGRHNEMAVRQALGAGRRRLLAVWIREGTVVGAAGGLGAAALALLATRVILWTAPEGLPRVSNIGLDATVIAFNFAVALAAGLLVGLLPALQHRSADLLGALKQGGRGRTGQGRGRLRTALVISEVALALVLIVASGLMIRSLAGLQRVDPGFAGADGVLTFRLPIPYNEIRSTETAVETVRQIAERLGALPGVESVGVTSSFPMDGRSAGDSIEVEGFPVAEGQMAPIRRLKFVAGDYFETLRIPLLAGRLLTMDDFSGRRPVVVVSESFARAHWDEPRDAVGQRLRPSASRWHEIVGVTGNVRDHGLKEGAPPLVYVPVAGREVWGSDDFFQRQLAFVVRAQRSPMALLPAVEEAILAVNPNLPVASVATLDSVLEREMARTSFTVLMLAIASAIAVILGAVGTYGVLSYAAAQRTREIGLRMALGADSTEIRRMVLRQGALVAAAGAALGVLAAAGFSRGMTSLLFGVSPTDPSTYVAAVLVVGSIALVASWLPARRAARVDPMRALRWE